MSAPPVVVGIDLGTSAFKALALDAAGLDVAVARVPTPWRQTRGTLAMSAPTVIGAVRGLLKELDAHTAGAPVRAIGVAGFAESGFLLDHARIVCSDALVWHTSLGADALAELRARFGDVLDGVTGLRRPELCSALRIRWLTRQRPAAPLGWVSVPEWVAWQMGGRLVAEYSLAARTGLFDVASRRWSAELVEWSGLDLRCMPALVPAGTPLGDVSVGASIDGRASLTVAGHDHLAGSIGAGALGDADAYDSFGTAEAVVRTLPRAAGPAEIADAVRGGCTRGPHVVGDRDYVFVGLDSGRTLQDVLNHIGVLVADPGRLDDEAAAVDASTALELAGRVFDAYGHLREPVPDVAPALIWRAALEFTAIRCRDALARLDERFGTRSSVVAAGGWLHSPLIRTIRNRYIAGLRVPATVEAGARGAARLAAVAAGLIPALGAWPDPGLTAE
jgi:sugar (pentulose or hexulose) kinase